METRHNKTTPVKDWEAKLAEFDKQQAKSDKAYYSHTIHINNPRDLNNIKHHKNGRQKKTINYE